MIVTFKRTGSRRYSITVERLPLTNLEMDPAPGYNPLVPHDLLHLVVEARLGLTRGIFGQLAAGGDAGTFHLTSSRNNSTKEFARERKRLRERGEKLLREGRAESAQSERATYICWQRWLARSTSHGDRGDGVQSVCISRCSVAKETDDTSCDDATGNNQYPCWRNRPYAGAVPDVWRGRMDRNLWSHLHVGRNFSDRAFAGRQNI